MTQDAPLDQKALEAAIAWAQEGTRDDTFSALTFDEHGALIERAIGIFLDALSRRVPASGGEHPDDLAVDRFAAAMKEKLAKKRAEGRGGWERKDECSAEFLSELLRGHVEKGDPLDVGNLAMMLHQRGERIAAPPIVAAPEGWPIKLDMVTSSQFVARVQSDALTTIALPMIEELSKRPQTVWGDIVKALRSKAEELWHAPSIPEGKAEPQP